MTIRFSWDYVASNATVRNGPTAVFVFGVSGKLKIVPLIIVPLSHIADYLYPFPDSHCPAEGMAAKPVSLLELPYFALWTIISGSGKCLFAQAAAWCSVLADTGMLLLPCSGQHPALLPACQLWPCQLPTLLLPGLQNTKLTSNCLVV